MSNLNYLESLTNKELHQECRSYGLPNIPVTDSSRQVIMKRLRSAILGTTTNKTAAAAAKKTPRRETIHSSKVAAKSQTTIADNVRRNNNNNNLSRRTIAAAPASTYDTDNVSVRTVNTTTTVSDVGSQSEDDDFYMVNNNRNVQYSPLSREDQRQRRSVSLTKSGVLTTSYTREVGNSPQPNTLDSPKSHTYERPSRELPIYEPVIEQRTFRPNYRSPLTQTQLNSTSYLEESGAGDGLGYNEYRSRQLPQIPRQSYGLGSGAGVATTAKPTVRQRQTIGSGMARGLLLNPTTTANSLYPQLNEFYDNQPHNRSQPHIEDDMDSESDVEDGAAPSVAESAYLKRFSGKVDAARRSPLARPQLRRSLQQQNEEESPLQQFRIFVSSLDRQYHLKRYFLLILVVMLLTFVYVLVSPSA